MRAGIISVLFTVFLTVPDIGLNKTLSEWVSDDLKKKVRKSLTFNMVFEFAFEELTDLHLGE